MQIPIEKIQILQLIADYKSKEESAGLDYKITANLDKTVEEQDNITIKVGATVGGVFAKYSSLKIEVSAEKFNFIPHDGYSTEEAIRIVSPEIGIMALSMINDFLMSIGKQKMFTHPDISSLTTNTFNRGNGSVGLTIGITMPNILAEYSGLTMEIGIEQKNISFGAIDISSRLKNMLVEHRDTVVTSLNKLNTLINKPTINFGDIK